MFLTIFRQELLNNLLTARFAICFIVVFFLTILSMVNSGIKYRRDLAAWEINTRAYEQEIRNATRLSESDRFSVQIPPNPLRVFSLGYDEEMVVPCRVEIPRPDAYGQYSAPDPVRIQYRVYDLGFAVAVILSLLAVFMGYDSMGGEDVRPTMRLILSNQISKSTYILGKLAGGYAVLAGSFVIAWTAGLAIMLVVQNIALSGDQWERVVLMLGAALLYIGVAYLVTQFVSALVSHSVRSLLVLVCIWGCVVMILPDAVSSLSKVFVPVSSEAALLQSKDRFTEEETAKVDAMEKKFLEKYGSHKDWPLEASTAFQKANVDRWFNLIENWRSTLEAQRARLEYRLQVNHTLARISPAAGFLACFSRLAGTGAGNFLRSEHWKRDLLTRTTAASKTVQAERRAAHPMSDFWAQQALITKDPMDPSRLPDRTYKRERVGTGLQAALGDIGILCLQAVGLFLATFLVFIRRRNI